MHTPFSRSGRVLFPLFLFCSLLFGNAAAAGEKRGSVPGDLPLKFEEVKLDSAKRPYCMPPQKIVQELRIKPGMTVLDLGAGLGYFTFPLADALEGTGRVFANDILLLNIRALQKRVKEGKYRNVTPVLVTSLASDPFYQKERFDIIFVSEVCNMIDDRPAFFRQLRSRLKPGGRLYIIDAEVHAVFHRGNIEDAGGLFRELRRAGEKCPIFNRLNGKLKKFIRHGDLDNPVPEAYINDLIGDLNRMLTEKKLHIDVSAYSYYSRFVANDRGKLESQLSSLHEYMLHWFEYQLQEADLFEKPDAEATPFELQSIQIYNRILVQSVFPEWINCLNFIAPGVPSLRTAIKQMREAGYTYCGSHDIMPAHYFLEFSDSEDRK